MSDHKIARSIINRTGVDMLIKIDKSWKYHKGEYLKNNTLKLIDVYKKGMIKQKNSDSPFILWADPDIAKLLDGLCYCCGRPRLLLNFGKFGWQETCIHSKMIDFKEVHCKYAGGKSGCKAKGRTDGNCEGKACPIKSEDK